MQTFLIVAEPKDVWRVLADVYAYPKWNPFIVSMSGEFRRGATLTLVMRDATGKERTVTPEVLVADPGKVRFVQDEHFRGLAVPLMSRWLRRTVHPQFHAMNRALAERV